MREILLRDKSRVQSIQARLRSLSLANNNMGELETVDLPAVNQIPSGGGNYFVTVGLGTPPKDVELAFDTGSDLTWAQCQPCAVACYDQSLPIFDPAASTTYSNLTCTSQACSQLEAATYYPGQCEENSTTCSYTSSYDDSSYSTGQLATDKLTLNSTDVVDGFIFGCGQNNFAYDVGYGGLMGLGTSSLSIDKVGFYYIEILAIRVNEQKLPISPAVFQDPGTIIDSGTVITRLPTLAYNALRDAFKQQMTMYPLVQNPSSSLLETCYDFTNYPNPTIPEISFTFGGNNNNVVVDLDPKGVMVPVYNDRSEVCLAFANSTDGGIFGNYQQQTFEVVYDVAGGQLGFASGGCS
nr:aspartyl protease family protein At5g10770-like [Ipomoea batatas]